VKILGTDTTHASPREILEKGVGHIPEDRHKHGMVLSYPIADNLVLSTYYQPPFAHGIVIDGKAIDENGRKLIGEFDIRTPSEYALAGTLSGGNQQKLIVAREFSRPIRLLISAQPTRGLDVGSIEFIHQKLIERRDAGTAILLVSVELDEVMALSDRIAVIYEGRIVETLPSAEATREELGLLMAGARKEGAIAR
jgi:simple sugar transport system ATP-binding protein